MSKGKYFIYDSFEEWYKNYWWDYEKETLKPPRYQMMLDAFGAGRSFEKQQQENKEEENE